MDGMTGGLMGGLGIDPMARFLPANSMAPMSGASSLGSQAAMMKLGTPQPGLMSQIGAGLERFGQAYGQMQGASGQSRLQQMQAPGLAQTGGGQMQMANAGQAPVQQSPTQDYMMMLDRIIAGAFD